MNLNARNLSIMISESFISLSLIIVRNGGGTGSGCGEGVSL